MMKKDIWLSPATPTKPPKLRWRPGQFYRDKATRQLYCVVFIYRLKSEPNEWRVELEERIGLGQPATFMSVGIGALVKDGFYPPEDKARITWEPLPDLKAQTSTHGDRDYSFGDRRVVTNKSMLNDYEQVR